MEDRRPEGKHRKEKISRRGFLGGVGAGAAGAIATRPGDVIAAVPGGGRAAPAAGIYQNTFSRLIPDLPPFAPATDQVRAAMMDIGKPGGLLDAKDPLEEGPIRLITNPELSPNNRDNLFHTAGTHFVGQFLDHDITFDADSELGVPVPPETSPNTRTPSLDLDSIYGRGPVADPQFYDREDRDKLRLESGGLFEDLPRDANGIAIIGDPRNDDNMMVAGLQAAFALFHNRVVERLRSQGVPPQNVFTEARRLVQWHWQWIVLHQFLYQLIGYPMVQEILTHGRRFYRPRPGEQKIPVEFQSGAYRVGHSMVRPSYRANLAGDNNEPFFGFIFDPAGEGQADPVDLRGGARAPRRFIGWQTFFDFRDGEVKPNKRMDTSISTPMFDLPLHAIPGMEPPTALPQRNMLRQVTWSTPSGQDLALAMGVPLLGPDQFPELRSYGLGLDASTPLWYYVLREAEVIADGIQLAGVGQRIVGEVLIGLVQLDPNSYLGADPGWRPTLPRRRSDDFTMEDLLIFAQVDPASRGQ